MLIGSLNNPANSPIKEAKWVLKNFDFLDLTLELPKARPDKIKVKPLMQAIEKSGKPVVGHTAWYLPVGSPFKELRLYALHELEKCAAVFQSLGADRFNVHFDRSLSMIFERQVVDFNVWTLRRLVKIGKRHGLNVMAENTPDMFNRPDILKRMFRKVPKLLLHLDIAHANIAAQQDAKRLWKNSTPEIMKLLPKRLAHVHISGNHGKHDEHLPIGKGNINWHAMLGAVKKSGYDGTISLEVFTSPADRLRDVPKLRKIWGSL